MNINRADVWKYAITWLNVKHQCISLAKLYFINEHLNKTVLALHMINRNWIKEHIMEKEIVLTVCLIYIGRIPLLSLTPDTNVDCLANINVCMKCVAWM